MDYEVGELQRQLANLIRVGRIAELDELAARVRVSVAGLKTDWLPWLAQRAGGNRHWHAPEVGEQVMVLAPYGDTGQAIVLPSLYQDAHQAPAASKDIERTSYADGTVAEYDRAAHKLTWDLGPTRITADRGALVLECNGSKITLDASGIKLVGIRIDLN